MNPYLAAFECYTMHERDVPWAEMLEYHFLHGAVLCNDRAMVCVRAVDSSMPDECHADLMHVLPLDQGDTWHVYCAAGDLKELLRFSSTNPKVWLSYERAKRPGVIVRARLGHVAKRV